MNTFDFIRLNIITFDYLVEKSRCSHNSLSKSTSCLSFITIVKSNLDRSGVDNPTFSEIDS